MVARPNEWKQLWNHVNWRKIGPCNDIESRLDHFKRFSHWSQVVGVFLIYCSFSEISTGIIYGLINREWITVV